MERMGALSLPSLSLGSLAPQCPRPFLHKPHSSVSFFFSVKPAPFELPPSSPSRRPFSLESSNGDRPQVEAQFFGEDGTVEDMDGYLNYLSLEYDSVWDTKPSWCQPWTILLTGVTVVALSWILFHSLVISAGVSSLICAWWYIFLYSYPKAYSDMIAERRKNVTTGNEDTFGLKKRR